MNFSDSFMQELKDRTNITDIASSYVSLKRKGRNMVGLCPFHAEKTPSFNIYPESESFYCFGCGVGGDVITFIRLIENLDYVEAIYFLAEKVGLDVQINNKDNELLNFKKRTYEINRMAAKYYHKMLYSKSGEEALNYLKKRGLSDKTIKHFGLGYAPNYRFSLVNFLKGKNYTNDEMYRANLAYLSKSQNACDRFWNRVMFPIIDLRGNVIAFGGRALEDIKPKYLNTSDTPVFKKNMNLFALNFAKNICKKSIILSEGYMDVIALHQAGFENTVATLGTSLTKEQVNILSRYTKEIIIAYDSDTAGKKATERAINMFKNTGLIVKVLTIPKGKDPDEFIRSFKENGAIRFKQLIEKSESDTEYILQKVKSGCNLNTSDGKIKYLKEAVKVLCGLQSRMEREIYASRLSEEIGVEKTSIMLQTDKLLKKQKKNRELKTFKNIELDTSARKDALNKEKSENLRASSAEEALLAYIINNPDMANNILLRLPEEKFSTEFNKHIYSTIMHRAKNNLPFDLTNLSGELSIEEMSRIAKMLSSCVNCNNNLNAADEYINVILTEKEKITQKQAQVTDAEDIKKYVDILKSLKK